MSDEADLDVELPDKLFFKIGETAEIVGVEAHVLRYWETEFRMRPQRSPAGQRLFRRKDVARFLRIKKLLHEQGFTIAGARKAMQAVSGDAEPAADEERVREALDRIRALRRKVQDLRIRWAEAPSSSAPET